MLPSVLERFRIGGEIYKCPKCGLLIEIDVEAGTKNAIGFEIDGKIYGICKARKSKKKPRVFYRSGIELMFVNKLPTHPDCLWTLIPSQIKQKGKRWE